MINLADYGFKLYFDAQDTNMLPARVTAVHKERFELICQHGAIYGKLKTGVYLGRDDEPFPTTGDFVLIDYINNGDSRIVKTLDRMSFFSRRDPDQGRGEQAIAANFDYVFVMASMNQNFNLNRIERYLTLAWQSGAVPVVVLTKSDLAEDYAEKVAQVEKVAIGVHVCAVSAKTGCGLDKLAEYLKPGKTIVFLGSSGIGKSSLVNALAGEELMEVSEMREGDGKGRHTTTHRQLIMLKSGAMIIDTPGMRELGVWDVTVGLSGAFEDVEQYVTRCRFSDCKHEREPGCAVRQAIEGGQLTHERWENYIKLKKEAKYSEDKIAYMRERAQWAKSIAKQQREQANHKS